ncbi:MAG: hypothetical protein GY765_03025 [bacterium]|nr:hypothetical protein [bacterium]
MSTNKIQIKIKNERGNFPTTAYPLHVLFTAMDCAGPAKSLLNTSMPLASFPTLVADSVKGGRLYIGCGPLPSKTKAGADGANQPVPNSRQYYGWIEFSCFGTDDSVFINLSNVDQTGLPLALSGLDKKGNPWTVGYKESNNDLLHDLKGVSKKTAHIEADTENSTINKVLAPNKVPDAYAPLDAYRDSLINGRGGVGAKVTSTSDVAVKSTGPIVFTGSFHPPQTVNNYVLTMKGTNGMYFRIKQDQLLTKNLYQCDGGTIYYANAPDLPYASNCFPQNNTDISNVQRKIPNSLFRNICIGFNEGYFTPAGENNTVNFCLNDPFTGGLGNPYARILHEESNSYGYPYADSNLKVLMNGNLSEEIQLTILPDDKAEGYNANAQSQNNYPLISKYHMAFGAGSDVGGPVTIGKCRYISSENYAGFLPIVSQWTKIVFNDPNHFIWFKTDGSVPDKDAVKCGSYAMGFNPNEIDGVTNFAFGPVTAATFAGKTAPGIP